MTLPVSRAKHWTQMTAAVVASVSTVWVASRVVNVCMAPKPCKPTVVAPRYSPPPLPVTPLPVTPRVIVPPQPVYPHLTPAFSAALNEGDLKGMDATYTSESSLDIALQEAVRTGRRDVVLWVLDKGQNANYNEGSTDAPLLLADGAPAIVKLLLERGANEPELPIAAVAGKPNAVTRILAKRKKGDELNDPTGALASAIGGSAEPADKKLIVNKLLAAGADPDGKDAAVVPLDMALNLCDAEDHGELCLSIVRALVNRRAEVGGDTLIAALNVGEDAGRAKMLDVLLAGKLEPGATTTALGAVSGDDPALVKKLASHGVSWTYADGEAEEVAPLVDAVDKNDVALVKAYLEAGAPADYQFKDGRTAFGNAIDATAGEGRIVELLIKHGANVNRRLPDGRSPLFAAAEAGDARTVNAILAAGARINERILDETAVDAAERTGHVNIARILDGRGGKRAPISQASSE